MVCVTCRSVGLSQSWTLQKQLNRSRCRLGCGLGLAQGTIPVPRIGAILRGNVVCTATSWLKEQDQQLFYDGIRVLEKRRTKCISVAGKYVEKWQNIMYILAINCVGLRTFWTPLVVYAIADRNKSVIYTDWQKKRSTVGVYLIQNTFKIICLKHTTKS